MATGGVAAARSLSDPARPYPPSWIDLLIARIRNAALPSTVIYLAALIPSILISNAANWASGLRPLGELTFTQTFWGVWTVGFIWLMDHLDNVARTSFDTFRPAISPETLDLDRARYELQVIPARPALIVTAIAVVFTLSYYAADPVASAIVGLTPFALAGRAAIESFSTALILNLVYHAVRQLRLVARLHDRADRIDLFHPAPVHAFSRLTAQTGAALIAIVTLGYLGNPVPVDRASFTTLWLPWLIVFPAIALAIFIAPLLGMHARLTEAKALLQNDANEHLKVILAELNHDVDRLDFGRADGLGKTMASLLQQREVLAKLPTWPWSVGTIRGFGTALLVPLGVFVLQRLLLTILPA